MTTIKPSDPRLTAFVLGELSADEAQEIQTAIASDAELQQEIEAIRQTVAQIETVMREEPLPGQDGRRQQSPLSLWERVRVRAVWSGENPHPSPLPEGEGATLRPSPKRNRWLLPAAVTAVAASLLVAFLIAYQQGGQIARNNPGLGSSSFPMPPEVQVERDAEKKVETTIAPLVETVVAEPTPLVKHELDYHFRSEGYDRFARPGQAQSQEVAEQPVPPAARGGNVVVGLRAPGEFTSDANVPLHALHADSFGREIPSFGGYNPLGGMGMGNMGETPRTSSAAQAPTRPVPALAMSDALPRDRSVAGNVIPGRVPATSTPPPARPERLGWVDVQPHPMPTVPPRNEERENSFFSQSPRDSFNNQRNEAFREFTENEFTPVKMGEFSTFSVDVDTAAYTVMRQYVNNRGQRPPAESVRLEEYINYFTYDYAQPDGDVPFATHVDVFPCPWQPQHLLARIGIKGKEYTVEERPALNLVFLVDVSGSMSPANRLPLVQQGLIELVEKLQPKDRVAIVTYANGTNLALPSVSAQEKRAIIDTINGLRASGGTYGESGIKLAYETARKYFGEEAQNRVILCTDGDFNIGATDNKTLEQLITEEAKSGVFLTVLGFGMGNLKDDRLKTLSMAGNGNYGYIDSIEECRKLLVEGLTGTLFTIAKDVKIQVDFNPAKVAGYRLLGYENRKLRDEDFHNDAVDAGDIGAGHTVTALYEIVPVGVQLPTAVDRSRYDTDDRQQTADGSGEEATASPHADELMFVKLRYKEPDGDKSTLLEFPVKSTINEANGDSQFASAVALYGMLLRSSRHSGMGSWDTVLELATPNTQEDRYREEFVELVRKARELR